MGKSLARKDQEQTLENSSSGIANFVCIRCFTSANVSV